MIKITCDICGKRIDFLELSKSSFDDKFQLCDNCMKLVEGRYKEWDNMKYESFLKWINETKDKAIKEAWLDAKHSAFNSMLFHRLNDSDEWRKVRCTALKNWFASLSTKQKHTHVVCKCKNGGAVATTCKCRKHEHKVVEPRSNLMTIQELSKAIGVHVRTISCYCYRHAIGIIDKKARVRVFNAEDAETVRKHFKGDK